MKIKHYFLLFIGFFSITLVGNAQAPNWSVNPNRFQYSMTITAVLDLNCTELTSPSNQLGAFVGDSLRGTAYTSTVIGGRYEASMTVYSDLVNGEKVTEPGYQVQEGDKIAFRGKLIRPEKKLVYLLLNKPKDYITTLNDDRGRRTVMELLKGKIKERIFPVGRLDRATTGLLLLTNDGELAEKMAHPSHKVKKVYHVVLDKSVTAADLDRIREGLELEDGLAPVNWVDYDGKGKDEVALEILFGRNRVVRRIFEHLGYEVKRLDRVYYAGLTKKDLPRGFWRHLTAKEVIMLKHFT